MALLSASLTESLSVGFRNSLSPRIFGASIPWPILQADGPLMSIHGGFEELYVLSVLRGRPG